MNYNLTPILPLEFIEATGVLTSQNSVINCIFKFMIDIHTAFL